MTGGAQRPATYAKCYEQAPDIVDATGTQSWITRSGNMVVVVTRAEAGAMLERADNPDESMLLLPSGVNARIEAGGESIEAAGDSLTILPGPRRPPTVGPMRTAHRRLPRSWRGPIQLAISGCATIRSPTMPVLILRR